LHPKVTRIPDRLRKQKTQRPSDNSKQAFSNDQKVVIVEKVRGIYTPNPHGVFTFLPMHFDLILALSKVLFGLFTRFLVEVPFTSRNLLPIIIDTPPLVLRRFLEARGHFVL
jgi:hypothetical protein